MKVIKKDELNDFSLISVIVPVYNVASFLERCIESLIKQTYVNLQIILVDDGSTDNSLDICERYKDIDERVHVIHKLNGGLSSSRNVGLDSAEGEYIFFLDGDDWIALDGLERLYQIMISERVDIVQAKICSVIEGEEDVIPDEKCTIERVSGKECLKKIFPYYGPDYASICNKMYRKKIWESLRFPEGLLFEDMYVNYKLYASADTIVVSSMNFYFYRKREGSICAKTSIYGHDDYLNAILQREELYQKNKWFDVYQKELEFQMEYLPQCYFDSKKHNDSERAQRIKKMFYSKYDVLKQKYNVRRVSWRIFSVSPWIYSIFLKIYSLIKKPKSSR